MLRNSEFSEEGKRNPELLWMFQTFCWFYWIHFNVWYKTDFKQGITMFLRLCSQEEYLLSWRGFGLFCSPPYLKTCMVYKLSEWTECNFMWEWQLVEVSTWPLGIWQLSFNTRNTQPIFYQISDFDIKKSLCFRSKLNVLLTYTLPNQKLHC